MSEEVVIFSPSVAYLMLLLSTLVISTDAQAISDEATDKEVLLELKHYFEWRNPIHHGEYARWNTLDPSPCNWSRITCSDELRVTSVDLSALSIFDELFSNFSLLTKLTRLDLSSNTFHGPIPDDLNKCSKLRYLNLSSNIIEGELNLTELTGLVMLDLTFNRLGSSICSNFPAICANLVSHNISTNNFSGDITGCFDDCPELKFLDLSSNSFTGQMWPGFTSLQKLFIYENYLIGHFPLTAFMLDCELEVLDISSNNFSGAFPDSIANCSKLTTLNLWGNRFVEAPPSGISALSELKVLYMGNNSFEQKISKELLNCSKLLFLDFSKNNFSGDVQEIFGQFTTLNYLILHGNNYTGGIESSGIPELSCEICSFVLGIIL